MEDADAIKDVVDDNAAHIHTASMDDLNGNPAVKEVAPMPYAVMAAGAVFVAGTGIAGAWCAAVTSPKWVPYAA